MIGDVSDAARMTDQGQIAPDDYDLGSIITRLSSGPPPVFNRRWRQRPVQISLDPRLLVRLAKLPAFLTVTALEPRSCAARDAGRSPAEAMIDDLAALAAELFFEGRLKA